MALCVHGRDGLRDALVAIGSLAMTIGDFDMVIVVCVRFPSTCPLLQFCRDLVALWTGVAKIVSAKPRL